MPFKLGGEIPKGHVKLPDPFTSDYLQASAATASSELEVTSSVDFSSYTITGTTNTTNTPSIIVSSSQVTVTSGAATSAANGDYYGFSIDIDLTDVSKINFTCSASAKVNGVPTTEGIDCVVLLDGTQVLSTSEIDVSSYTGTHTLEFRVVNNTGNTISSTIIPVLSLTVSDMYLTKPIPASNVLDENTSTYWSPSTSNAGEYIYLDLGVPTILGGARIYWLDAVPNKYRIQVSLDATNWKDVYVATSAPNANDWTEYSWYATYARYLRLYLDDQGTTPVKVAVFDYYSRITDRVAAEHGHGSGVEKWKKGRHARRGFQREKLLNGKISQKKKKSKLSKQDILELIEELKDYVDFKVPD